MLLSLCSVLLKRKAISAISFFVSVSCLRLLPLSVFNSVVLSLSLCHALRLEQVWPVLWRCWRWWKHLWMSQTTRCGVTWAVIWVFCPVCSHTLTSMRTSRSSSEISSSLSAWSWAGTVKPERVRARTEGIWTLCVINIHPHVIPNLNFLSPVEHKRWYFEEAIDFHYMSKQTETFMFLWRKYVIILGEKIDNCYFWVNYPFKDVSFCTFLCTPLNSLGLLH